MFGLLTTNTVRFVSFFRDERVRRVTIARDVRDYYRQKYLARSLR